MSYFWRALVQSHSQTPHQTSVALAFCNTDVKPTETVLRCPEIWFLERRLPTSKTTRLCHLVSLWFGLGASSPHCPDIFFSIDLAPTRDDGGFYRRPTCSALKLVTEHDLQFWWRFPDDFGLGGTVHRSGELGSQPVPLHLQHRTLQVPPQPHDSQSFCFVVQDTRTLQSVLFTLVLLSPFALVTLKRLKLFLLRSQEEVGRSVGQLEAERWWGWTGRGRRRRRGRGGRGHGECMESKEWHKGFARVTVDDTGRGLCTERNNIHSKQMALVWINTNAKEPCFTRRFVQQNSSVTSMHFTHHCILQEKEGETTTKTESMAEIALREMMWGTRVTAPEDTLCVKKWLVKCFVLGNGNFRVLKARIFLNIMWLSRWKLCRTCFVCNLYGLGVESISKENK